MAHSVRASAVSLHGDPRSLETGPVKWKLFFEEDDPDRYGELFLDLDLRARRLRLGEKDNEYRKAIVAALSGGVGLNQH
jgi:hypothetical protein